MSRGGLRPRTRNQWDHHYRNLYSGNVNKRPNDRLIFSTKSFEKHDPVILVEESEHSQEKTIIYDFEKNDAKSAPSRSSSTPGRCFPSKSGSGVESCRGKPQTTWSRDEDNIYNDDHVVYLDTSTSEDNEELAVEDSSKLCSESSYYSSYDDQEPFNELEPIEGASAGEGESGRVVKSDSAGQNEKVKGKAEIVKIEEESDSDSDSDDGYDNQGSSSPLNLKRKLENFVPNTNDDHRFINIGPDKREGSKKESRTKQQHEINEVCSSIAGDVKFIDFDGEKCLSSRAEHHKREFLVKLGTRNECFKNIPLGYEGASHVKWAARMAPQFSLSKKKNSQARNEDWIKILVESINLTKEYQPYAGGNVCTGPSLPLRFGFEDEVESSRVQSEHEKEIDLLFCGLDMGLLEFEIDRASSYAMEYDDDVTEIDQSPAACCARGQHVPIIDEQIGIICEYCLTVILEIKHVLPPFYTRPPGRRKWKEPDGPPSYHVDQIHLNGSGFKARRPVSRTMGTVWDLIPGIENEMYPHQREGFEFMWKNIAGGIVMDNMKYPLSGGRGCVISHAPGTGKTRLAIVFLQAFLKLYPSCKPVIIAPKGMLLTWESEFLKWEVDIPFHNLNKKELSENEHTFATHVLLRAGKRSGPMSLDCIRLTKLASWVSGTSILGISYQAFTTLVRSNKENGGLAGQIEKLLLVRPDLLVLDEGHTPRNDKSQIWKALSKVGTQRRIILSGTPFQNNLSELYNTLCIVNPRFANGIMPDDTESKRGRKCRLVQRKNWVNFAGSIGKGKDSRLRKLRAMLSPFVHVHKGTILEESLPGLRVTLVFLHPSKQQRVLLEASARIDNIFNRIHQVSLISVHPSLAAFGKYPQISPPEEEEEESVDTGVKTTFVMKLVRLANSLGERVLIFSQFLDPLIFIMKQIKSQFSWHEGREVLYMDGQLDEKQRQDSIYSFNNESSEAKVLLASERACSEGINLVGASRVVLLDTVWNPSVEKQAVSRAYRLGQRRIVHVYRLFTSGTEVRQYAQQIQKERISQLLFSPGDGDGQPRDGDSDHTPHVDTVLEAMLGMKGFANMFERVICQPKESELIAIFGLAGQS